MAKYDNKTKYKIIDEVCNGKAAIDIQREYGIGTATVMCWLRTFAENGPFKGDKLTPKDYARLEKLQESAKKRELEMRFHGTTTNESFEWLLEYDPALAEWKAYAEEWIKTVVRGKATALAALSSFFKRWTELTRGQLGKAKDIKILKAMGTTAFLFRDAASRNKHLPLRNHALDPLWYKLLQCLEQKVNQNATTEAEQNLKFVHDDLNITTYYPLHSLRVSLITAFALEGGVPMPVLSKCIAGHARLVMTLYYTKMGISYITDTMKKADTEILKQDQESFERFIRDAKYKQLEIGTAVNDTAAYDAVLSAQKSKASIVMSDKGICPKGCFGCDTGGTYVNDDTDKVTYGPVQGYPAHNCVRCRWFITGPAFLPGLVNHFNVLSYEMAETSKRVIRYQNKTEELENSKYEAEQHGAIFEQYEELLKYEKLLQQELQKGDDIANNLNATLRLIDKCQKISKSGNDNDSSSTQLVPVGTVQDVGFLLETEADEMHQLQAICNGAELFPETDASKALLKRSQIIDMTLLFNKKQPVMFTLSDEEQLLAGNQFMRLLIKRAGSLKEAIPYAIGRKKLEEIGIHNEFEKELKIMRYDAPLKLLSTNNDA